MFYRLRTHHGGLLAEDLTCGEVSSFAEADIGTERPVLLLYSAETRPEVGFLISATGSRLWVKPTLEGAGVIAVGVARDAADGVALYDPGNGLWACAAPGNDQTPSRGGLSFAVKRVSSYERFTVETVAAANVPPHVADTAARVDHLLARPFDAEILLTAQPSDGPLVEALSRFLSRFELNRMAQRVVRSDVHRAALAALFPGDLGVQPGLNELARWMAARSAVSPSRPSGWRALFQRRRSLPAAHAPETLGPAFDRLALLDKLGPQVSLPNSLNVLARQAVEPTRSVCIIATARNEGIYLLDWIAYHRAIGVTAFFLYTNDNDDGSDILLDALASAGVVHLTRNLSPTEGSVQLKAYGHALGIQPGLLDFEWAMLIDLDEFFVFDTTLFRSAPDYLRWQDATACDAISLNWVMCGPSGQSKWRDDFIARRFPEAPMGVDAHVKSLCRPRLFAYSYPHHPVSWRKAPFRTNNGSGRPHEAADPLHPAISVNPSAECACIYHYFYKSTEEFLWKWSRGRSGGPAERQRSTGALTKLFVDGFVQQFHKTGPKWPTLDACAPEFAAERERLLALPGVAQAVAMLKRDFVERMPTIVSMFRSSDAILGSVDGGKAFWDTLEPESMAPNRISLRD